MPLPESAEFHLSRFGCVLEPTRHLIHIGCDYLTFDQVVRAPILLRSLYQQCPSGPALCLALELSPTRALPRYCYITFNLADPDHLSYLTSIGEGNRLSINLAGRGFEVKRQHELISAESNEFKESLTQVQAALSTTILPYNFDKITDEFETIVRIPHLFERRVSEAEFAKILPVMASNLEKIPAERRALGQSFVRELADSLQSHWEGQVKKSIAEFPQYRDSLTLLLDLRRIFSNDYEGFINFLGDAFAFSTDEERLMEMKKWTPQVVPIVKLFNLGDSASPDKRGKALRDLGEAVLALLNMVRRGRVLSQSMLHTLIPPLKPFLQSQPGRPTRDYSREYEWKKTMSWTQVTRRSLIENEDIREEFRGQTYDVLSLEQRLSLAARIREGVKSYAERMGKPFPIVNSPE